MLLQKQVQLLQDEVTRLRLRGEEPDAEKAEPGSKRLTNGESGDSTKGKKVRNRPTKDDLRGLQILYNLEAEKGGTRIFPRSQDE